MDAGEQVAWYDRDTAAWAYRCHGPAALFDDLSGLRRPASRTPFALLVETAGQGRRHRPQRRPMPWTCRADLPPVSAGAEHALVHLGEAETRTRLAAEADRRGLC